MKRIILIGMACSLLAGCFNSDMADEEHARREGKDLNDLRIEQNDKCIKAGMRPDLTEDKKIVCAPSSGAMRLRDYYEILEADRVIREKSGKSLPKKLPPVDPESFETKSKVTQ